LRLEKDVSFREVPNKMATDFVGFRAMPFSQNQVRREFRHVRLKRSNILVVICRKKRYVKLRVICMLLLRDMV